MSPRTYFWVSTPAPHLSSQAWLSHGTCFTLHFTLVWTNIECIHVHLYISVYICVCTHSYTCTHHAYFHSTWFERYNERCHIFCWCVYIYTYVFMHMHTDSVCRFAFHFFELNGALDVFFVCTYLYMCMHVYIHTLSCTHTHTRAHTYAYTHTRTHAVPSFHFSLNGTMYVFMCVCTFTHMYVYIYTHTLLNTHTHTHTHIHTHTHTHMRTCHADLHFTSVWTEQCMYLFLWHELFITCAQCHEICLAVCVCVRYMCVCVWHNRLVALDAARHDSIIYRTWLIHTYDMTHSSHARSAIYMSGCVYVCVRVCVCVCVCVCDITGDGRWM